MLPIEVIGPNGTVGSTSLTLTSSQVASAASLWMQANNLSYADKASVQINHSAWVPLDNTSATVAAPGSNFGGIGGAFSNLQLTIPVPQGSLVAGANTINFMMNQTDGLSIGFRIIGVNLLDSSGNQLIPSTAFTWDDPNSWTAPLNDPANIAAGQQLWQSAPLMSSSLSTAYPLQAHCGDCHASDGRDLHYFNFSNNSIIQRSIFHGLTQLQGEQIASFIRSGNFPNPGTPWNPPYQPGPGLNSQPVSNWAAGAGVDWVLNNDADTIPYMFPNGYTADAVAATGWVDIHEIPVFLPMPTWNQWLPAVHPLDAWGATFTHSAMNTRYQSMRSNLTANQSAYILPQSGSSGLDVDMYDWVAQDRSALFAAAMPGWPSNTFTQALSNQVLQTAHWQLVKNWEIMQGFGLEAAVPAAEGWSTDDRAWESEVPFFVSTNLLGIPFEKANGAFGGNLEKEEYFNNAWYYLQVILHSGQRARSGNTPIDWGYIYGVQMGIAAVTGQPANADGALMALTYVRGQQEQVTWYGLLGPAGTVNPDPQDFGWNPNYGANVDYLAWPDGQLNDIPAGVLAPMLTAIVQSWFNQVQQYTAAQYYQVGLASSTYDPTGNFSSPVWGDRIWDMIPRFRADGVDGTLLNSICQWAATVWPRKNWNSLEQKSPLQSKGLRTGVVQEAARRATGSKYNIQVLTPSYAAKSIVRSR
jgi:hypothetical protein